MATLYVAEERNIYWWTLEGDVNLALIGLRLGSKTFSCKVVATSFLYLMVHRWIASDVPIYIKLAIKVNRAFRKRRFRRFRLIVPQRWELAKKVQLSLIGSRQYAFQKTQKLLTKFPGLATSGCHNSAMIIDAENSLRSDPSMGCLISISAVRINSNFFPWVVLSVQAAHPNISRLLRNCVLSHCNADISHSHAANHHRLLSHVTLCLIQCRVYKYKHRSNAVNKTAWFTCADAET